MKRKRSSQWRCGGCVQSSHIPSLENAISVSQSICDDLIEGKCLTFDSNDDNNNGCEGFWLQAISNYYLTLSCDSFFSLCEWGWGLRYNDRMPETHQRIVLWGTFRFENLFEYCHHRSLWLIERKANQSFCISIFNPLAPNKTIEEWFCRFSRIYKTITRNAKTHERIIFWWYFWIAFIFIVLKLDFAFSFSFVTAVSNVFYTHTYARTKRCF